MGDHEVQLPEVALKSLRWNHQEVVDAEDAVVDAVADAVADAVVVDLLARASR